MSQRIVRWLYAALCAILAVALMGFASEDLRTWKGLAAAPVSFMGGVSLFFALTSVSVARAWRLGRWLAGASGLVLVVYAASVILLGWEDVGGARGAIPLSVGTGVAGALGIWVASSKARHAGMAV
jgi:hypothetical protein